ncbi:uncharacterized protein LOC116853695 [Odontomachus brunneus]|uniref:uncharacterized protein LOC116853695 n=1 Tax=Odontomachus brunneus TaxID=486640 RepID=UPI0013F18B63|nr:uncharacterized protein LOC116853695 [Odontomachus brunneus]
MSRVSVPSADLSLRQEDDGHETVTEREAAAIEAVSSCRLPPFWRAKPDFWFVQAEAALQVEKYHTLKSAILTRLTDSADRQLLKLFTQLELGDRRPSQLLRHMRGLSANRVPDDVLRVKWLDLLPVSAQRLLRILKTPSLEELATMSDEIVEASPGVAAASLSSSEPESASSAVGVSRPPSRSGSEDQFDRLTAELASMRVSLAQVVGLNREILSRVEGLDSEPRPPDIIARRFGPGKLTAPAQVQASESGDRFLKENRLHVFDRVTNLKFLVDSGSVVSLLPRSAVKERIKKQELTLQTANASAIATYGRRTLTLNLALRRPFKWTFIVADVRTASVHSFTPLTA